MHLAPSRSSIACFVLRVICLKDRSFLNSSRNFEQQISELCIPHFFCDHHVLQNHGNPTSAHIMKTSYKARSSTALSAILTLLTRVALVAFAILWLGPTAT